MLGQSKAFSGFSVDDIPAARAFYEGTLGLRVSEADGRLTLHLAGGRDTIVYSFRSRPAAPRMRCPPQRHRPLASRSVGCDLRQ